MTASALSILLHLAAAAQLTVSDGEEVTIPVAPAGVTLQLPDYVRVVTPSAAYVVRPLVPPRPASARGDASPEGEKSDVRVFLVRPARAEPQEQPVTFLLADGRSLTARFLPGTSRDESFLDLRWAKRGSNARTRGGEQFLAAERALLLTMLRDDRSPGRKVVEQQIELPGYSDLDVKLVRVHETPDGLAGGVYTFTNRSKRTVVVNPTVLAVGTPNRAILTQMDHEELRPCAEDASSDPRGTGCTSVVRIVSRAPRPELAPGADRGSVMPYVLAPVERDKR
jgi:hypothetical protein